MNMPSTKSRIQLFHTIVIKRMIRMTQNKPRIVIAMLHKVRKIIQEIEQVIIIINQQHHYHNLQIKEISPSNLNKVKEMIINMLLLKVFLIKLRGSNNSNHNTNSLTIVVTSMQCLTKEIVDVLQYYPATKTTTTTIRAQLHL